MPRPELGSVRLSAASGAGRARTAFPAQQTFVSAEGRSAQAGVSPDGGVRLLLFRSRRHRGRTIPGAARSPRGATRNPPLLLGQPLQRLQPYPDRCVGEMDARPCQGGSRVHLRPRQCERTRPTHYRGTRRPRSRCVGGVGLTKAQRAGRPRRRRGRGGVKLLRHQGRSPCALRSGRPWARTIYICRIPGSGRSSRRYRDVRDGSCDQRRRVSSPRSVSGLGRPDLPMCGRVLSAATPTPVFNFRDNRVGFACRHSWGR